MMLTCTAVAVIAGFAVTGVAARRRISRVAE